MAEFGDLGSSEPGCLGGGLEDAIIVAWTSYSHLCASVNKQNNLVPAKGLISLAGKVTVDLVESNSSLPPGL